MKRNITTWFLVLSFYCFGAGVIDSFAMYHSWLFVGEEEFAMVHQQSGQRILLFFVFPTLVLTIITIMMFWHRPVIIPKRLLWFAFSCQMISWISSAFIQIPIQMQLDSGKDIELLNKLITTDWIRIIAWMFYIVVVFRIMRMVQVQDGTRYEMR